MGSNLFQKEYIEYLQEKNAELIAKLNYMKQLNENKILSRDLNKQYLTSTLQHVSHICTEIPEEIDLFFDKMTEAMNVLKKVLLRKAEMVQLVEKISKAINSTEKHNSDFIAVDGSDLREQVSEIRTAGIVKVSPMINGNIISTEPRIYLNRMPEVFTPRHGAHQLSPIIEASPDISDTSNVGMQSLKEMTVPLERLNLNKLSFSYMNEGSPKNRFKGPKKWKRSLSSTKCQSENQKNLSFLENKESNNRKISVGEIENIDPLEGPSWLHSENETNSPSSPFMDYRRRKHRFATVFVKSEEQNSSFERKTFKSLQKNEDEEEEEEEEGEDNEQQDGEDVDGGDESYENLKTNDDKEGFEELKRNSESYFEETELEEKISPSFKNSYSVSRRCLKHENRTSANRHNDPEGERENPPIKGATEKKFYDRLEDYTDGKETTSKKSETKVRSTKNSNKPLSNEIPKLLVENEGRKKRKAAPTFKLVEPKLSTKLRRN